MKKYSDLLKEIHVNSKTKEEQLNTLILELKPLITSVGEATIIVPLLAKYIEMGIKNDDNLIKLASLVQKSITNTSNENNDGGLTEAERKQLFDEIKNYKKE